MISLPDALTVLADRLLSRRSSPLRLRRSADDVYLAPHSDDIAFSIGSFTRARGTGRLLTIFGRSNFTLSPPSGALSIDEVSALRRAEDLRFAQACGLEAQDDLGLPEAPLRGREPMDGASAPEDLPALSPPILEAILRLGQKNQPGKRPWLFAPMALGGHIDHAVVLLMLAQHRAAIERRFRLAFYEDLPYAAHYELRVEGMPRFRRAFGILGWRRHLIPLGAAMAGKLELIGLYGSQHLAKPSDIKEFTPVCRFPTPPHEAIWIRGSPRRG